MTMAYIYIPMCNANEYIVRGKKNWLENIHARSPISLVRTLSARAREKKFHWTEVEMEWKLKSELLFSPEASIIHDDFYYLIMDVRWTDFHIEMKNGNAKFSAQITCLCSIEWTRIERRFDILPVHSVDICRWSRFSHDHYCK